MSNIGFMRNTTKHIETVFAKYLNDKKKYPSATEKAEYKNFIYQMERLKRFGEIEDELEYKRLMKILKQCDLTSVVVKRKKG